VVVGDRGDTREQALRDAHERRGVRELGVDADPAVRRRHRLQPLAHDHATRAGQCSERALQQVVMRVHETRRHDATRRIQHLGRVALAGRRDRVGDHEPVDQSQICGALAGLVDQGGHGIADEEH